MAISLPHVFAGAQPGSAREVVDKLKADLVRRSYEGAGALAAIMSEAFSAKGLAKRPERAAYVSAAAVNVVSSACGWEKPRRAAKAVLMPLLAVHVHRRRHETSPLTAGALLVGLAGGWIGDVVLMPKKPNLNLGAIPFAVNHVAYQVLLWRAGARFNTLRSALRYPLWAGSIGLVGLVQPRFVPAAAGYGLLVATTSVLADDSSLTHASQRVTVHSNGLPSADATFGLGHGGNLFLISDALLVLRTLIGDEGLLARALDACVMDTYTVAQLLLVEGLLASDPA
ncbi:lysoplasmalogenase [Corynebacterium timonense]|uniref:YhhN-like protein n=1 Tax=Corynebacterium timonense TaxID=441500 RepID=A0A1H1N7Y6_9CORY|nr:lysoplasmalogenase [Corynebacterium timonense]SDR95211.1 YhhN-like protein [Corynebacterium timonense]